MNDTILELEAVTEAIARENHKKAEELFARLDKHGQLVNGCYVVSAWHTFFEPVPTFSPNSTLAKTLTEPKIILRTRTEKYIPDHLFDDPFSPGWRAVIYGDKKSLEVGIRTREVTELNREAIKKGEFGRLIELLSIANRSFTLGKDSMYQNAGITPYIIRRLEITIGQALYNHPDIQETHDTIDENECYGFQNMQNAQETFHARFYEEPWCANQYTIFIAALFNTFCKAHKLGYQAGRQETEITLETQKRLGPKNIERLLKEHITRAKD